MSTTPSQSIAQAAADAASAPAFKFSAFGTTLVVSVDWLFSGPGLIALAGLLMTACTFLVNTWTAYRRERRDDQRRSEEAAINAAKLDRLRNGMPIPPGIDSDRVGLDP